MSAKSSIKVLVPEDESSSLFKWVAVLTGSKNALKGVGFFLGGLLLSGLWASGSRCWAMAGALLAGAGGLRALAAGRHGPVEGQGQVHHHPVEDARHQRALGRALLPVRRPRHLVRGGGPGVPLGAARVGLPRGGRFLALWVIGYGAIQSAAPALIRRWTRGHAPEGRATFVLALLLAGTSVAHGARHPREHVTHGAPCWWWALGVFGAIFAVNSSVHSYLILAYSDADKVAMNVGFYYMANAAAGCWARSSRDCCISRPASRHRCGGPWCWRASPGRWRWRCRRSATPAPRGRALPATSDTCGRRAGVPPCG
jgi:hypothetical protein